jgi:pre-mRNA-splicing factor ISY1
MVLSIFQFNRNGKFQEKRQEDDAEDVSTEQHTIAPLEVPSQKDVEIELLRKKKMELLLKYASEDLQNMSMNAKTLMGRNLNI